MIAWRNGPRVRTFSSLTEVPALSLPAVLLVDPKYAHNVGQVVRLACCFGLSTVLYTGKRVALHDTTERLPREERMRDYADVSLVNCDRPMELVRGTPVAIEMRPNAESLPDFEHPADAVYVFGPEDGSLGRLSLQHCHRFVTIPTRHCLNLATAVSTVLYDRAAKERRV